MGGSCLPVQCDVGEEFQFIAGVQKVVDTWGKIDILVNNAGMMAYCPTVDLSLEQWQKVVNVSLTGYFLMARECAKSMIQNQYGRIINMVILLRSVIQYLSIMQPKVRCRILQDHWRRSGHNIILQ